MKKTIIVMSFLALSLTGCTERWTSLGLGAAGGAAAGAGGYEYHINKEKDRVEQDYNDGKITKEEYDIRIDQINRDSLLK